MTAARHLKPVPESDLDHLARRVRAGHAGVRACAHGMVEHAVAAGQALQEARAQLSHGQWLPWVALTGVSPRQAQKYMRLAKYAPGAHLPDDATINEALDLLAGTRKQPGYRFPEFPGPSPELQQYLYELALARDPEWRWLRAVALIEEGVSEALRVRRPDGEELIWLGDARDLLDEFLAAHRQLRNEVSGVQGAGAADQQPTKEEA